MHNTRFFLLIGSLALAALCGCKTVGLKLINVLGLSRPGAFRMPGLIDEVMRFIMHPSTPAS